MNRVEEVKNLGKPYPRNVDVWSHKVTNTEVLALQFVLNMHSQDVGNLLHDLLDFDYGTGEGEEMFDLVINSPTLGEIEVKPKDYIVVNNKGEVTVIDECAFVENYRKAS